MAAATIGAFGVVTPWTLLATVLICALIGLNADRLYLMMVAVSATFQATVANLTWYLRLLWGPVVERDDGPVVANPGQRFVIPNELPIDPHRRGAIRYQTEFPPLKDFSSGSSDDNHDGSSSDSSDDNHDGFSSDSSDDNHDGFSSDSSDNNHDGF